MAKTERNRNEWVAHSTHSHVIIFCCANSTKTVTENRQFILFYTILVVFEIRLQPKIGLAARRQIHQTSCYIMYTTCVIWLKCVCRAASTFHVCAHFPQVSFSKSAAMAMHAKSRNGKRKRTREINNNSSRCRRRKECVSRASETNREIV